jgi:hypothetical protein
VHLTEDLGDIPTASHVTKLLLFVKEFLNLWKVTETTNVAKLTNLDEFSGLDV